MKEYINDIKIIMSKAFDIFAIMMLISVFISGLIVFSLLVGDPFLIALKDSFVITFSMAVLVLLGAYIKHIENKE